MMGCLIMNTTTSKSIIFLMATRRGAEHNEKGLRSKIPLTTIHEG